MARQKMLRSNAWDRRLSLEGIKSRLGLETLGDGVGHQVEKHRMRRDQGLEKLCNAEESQFGMG